MGLREDLIRRIDRKIQEVKELELQIREANAYIQGLQDVIKLLPRETTDAKRAEHTLRPNSDMAKVQDYLRKMGIPMYIGDILEGIGKGDSKAHRLSLSGSLGDYVRRGEIFNRPAPNTFGLLEFGLQTPINIAKISQSVAQAQYKEAEIEMPQRDEVSQVSVVDDDPFGDDI